MTLQALQEIYAESGFDHAEFCIEQENLTHEQEQELKAELWRLVDADNSESPSIAAVRAGATQMTNYTWVAGISPTVEEHETGRVVAKCDAGKGQWKIEGEEAKRNARLIAAAPDMLSALKQARLTLDSRDGTAYVLGLVIAAIDKAEG